MQISQRLNSSSKKFSDFCKLKKAEFENQNPNLSKQGINKLLYQQWISTQKKPVKRGISSKKKPTTLPKQLKKQDLGEPSLIQDLKQDLGEPSPVKLQFGQKSPIRQQQPNEVQESNKFRDIEEDLYIAPTPIKTSKKQKITKKISKKRKNYQSFQECFYEKLHNEHPKWSRSQIYAIIKLLWRKRQTLSKGRSQIKKERQMRMLKAISGRSLFGLVKRRQDLKASEIATAWKVLPRQSRKHWQQKGENRNGLLKRQTLQTLKHWSIRFEKNIVERPDFKFSSSISIGEGNTPFSFMNNII